jgi:hypothetical protein
LQRWFHLQSEDMQEHTKSVFEKSVTKLVGQSISNGWIYASNEYLQTIEGQQMSSFHDGSDIYLTEEQYAMVQYVGPNFISLLTLFLLFLVYN